MDAKTGDHRVLLGNEAISRGLVEAGCQFMSAYPGTPSSEILPAVIRFKDELGVKLYAEWSTNEKVALETALAAAYTGKRAAVAMKQVGLNVAADPATSAAYVGVLGGLLLIVADDPGLHSSQTEQDSRLFALFSKIPALDPGSPAEAKELVLRAFELSERHGIPVILRPTVRICHSEQLIDCRPAATPGREAAFEKNPRRWAATPASRMVQHRELNQKLAAIEEEFETWPGNRANVPPALGDAKAPLGIVASGVTNAYLHDILVAMNLADRLPVLSLVTAYPVPRRLIANFAARCERLLVIEETDAAIELQIRLGVPVWGRLTGHIPSQGELTPDVLEKLLAAALAEAGIAVEARKGSGMAAAVAELKLPIRRPTFCAGCGHRATFYALRRAFPDALFPGDIGCYTLGLNQGSVDTVLDMGASITIASGLYHAYKQDGAVPPIIATIGDGTFFHSGAVGLENAIYNGARFVLLVLDNGTTGMTGGQPTAEAGDTADGHAGGHVDLETLVRGCGVQYVAAADPHNLQGFERAVRDALDYVNAPDGGIAVIFTDYPCVTKIKSLGPEKTPQAVDVIHGPRPRSPQMQAALDPAWMPRHQDQLSPCAVACPAGNDIERLMTLAGQERWEEAAQLIYAEHPFPSTLGRVCPHPCETGCNRASYDGALAINALERLVGDHGRSAAGFVTREPPRDKRIAIIGGGPAGLAAAYQLARFGYGVDVFEAQSEVGGMLRWAITEYRLPAAVLQRELEAFAALGVSFHTGKRLGDNLDWSALDAFDAIFLATGAWRQRRLSLSGAEQEGILSGLDYLNRVRAGDAPSLGNHVAVIGGGNTAIDAARTARRLGASQVDVYYDVLLAIPEEVSAARAEGIVFHHEIVPAAFGPGKTRNIEIGLRGFRATGKEATSRSEHDSVLVCIGGDADLGYLDEAQQSRLAPKGRLAVDAWGRGSDPRIFAGGDASTLGSGTVVGAINGGKRAALAIHERLAGIVIDSDAVGLASGPGISVAIAAGQASGEPPPRAAQLKTVAGPQVIRMQHFRKLPRAEVPHRAPDNAVWNFEEVSLGLGTRTGAAEAETRCFHCGVCTHCDICVDVCPTGAISEVDGTYRIDAAKCTGCRVCAVECPRNAITMPATGVCVACGYCTTWFECPSLRRGADGLVNIDRRTCVDCGMCIQVCAQGAIRPRVVELAKQAAEALS